MNSSWLPASSMTASTVVMSWNFQLFPRTAARYSPVRSPLVRRFCRYGLRVDRPCSRQSWSLTALICSRVLGVKWSFFPVSGWTELTTKWEWGCSASTWVATSTSQPGKNRSASSRAIWWASAGITFSCGEKDWT
nr:hypothetical protein [Lawsonibacter hominis]